MAGKADGANYYRRKAERLEQRVAELEGSVRGLLRELEQAEEANTELAKRFADAETRRARDAQAIRLALAALRGAGSGE